ncbi:MAG: hypothetical protein NXH74_10355 [Rhodobacteraceae bacterium]|nr:hypothetical protein [Paracoccaceae bacterium]
MSGKTLTLLAILAFVTLTVGSFVWFIVTWDKSAEEPVTWVDRIELGAS